MMSSGPQNFESAISIEVPAVLLVLRKMNLCLWETIMAVFLTCPQEREPHGGAGYWRAGGKARTFFRQERGGSVCAAVDRHPPCPCRSPFVGDASWLAVQGHRPPTGSFEEHGHAGAWDRRRRLRTKPRRILLTRPTVLAKTYSCLLSSPCRTSLRRRSRRPRWIASKSSLRPTAPFSRRFQMARTWSILAQR